MHLPYFTKFNMQLYIIKSSFCLLSFWLNKMLSHSSFQYGNRMSKHNGAKETKLNIFGLCVNWILFFKGRRRNMYNVHSSLYSVTRDWRFGADKQSGHRVWCLEKGPPSGGWKQVRDMISQEVLQFKYAFTNYMLRYSR